jgi:hypothetical protein
MQYFISIKYSRHNYSPLLHSSMHTLIIPCVLYMLSYLLFLAYYSGYLVKYLQTWKLPHVLHAFDGSYFFFVEGDFT